MKGICSHCSAVVDILSTENANSDSSSNSWTSHTLQQILYLGSLKEGEALLRDFSSTAMYNLLVLLELNVKTLPKDTLEQFIEKIEQLSYVIHDDWCRFLIQRLKRHFENTNCQPLVSLEKDTAHQKSPLTVGTSGQCNDVEMEVEAVEESPVCITTASSEELDSLSAPSLGHGKAVTALSPPSLIHGKADPALSSSIPSLVWHTLFSSRSRVYV